MIVLMRHHSSRKGGRQSQDKEWNSRGGSIGGMGNKVMVATRDLVQILNVNKVIIIKRELKGRVAKETFPFGGTKVGKRIRSKSCKPIIKHNVEGGGVMAPVSGFKTRGTVLACLVDSPMYIVCFDHGV